MEFIEKLYLQILNLIRDLLKAFGADLDVINGLIDDANKENEEV